MRFFNLNRVGPKRSLSPFRCFLALAVFVGLVGQNPLSGGESGQSQLKRNPIRRLHKRKGPKIIPVQPRIPAYQPEASFAGVNDPGRTIAKQFPTKGLTAPEKTGVTLYQIDGFRGTVPMKVVSGVGSHGNEVTQLVFASSNMNQTMQWMAKAVAPSGTVFKSFEVSTSNGIVGVTPNSADSYDGKTIVAKVSLKPWRLSSLLRQCREQMTNPDGSFKDSVTFDLQGGADIVHGKAVFAYEADPNDPTKWLSRTARAYAKTRVTVHLVNSHKQAKPKRPSRLSQDASANKQFGRRRPPFQAMRMKTLTSGGQSQAAPVRRRPIGKRLIILDSPSNNSTHRHSRSNHRKFYEEQLRKSYRRYPDRRSQSRSDKALLMFVRPSLTQ